MFGGWEVRGYQGHEDPLEAKQVRISKYSFEKATFQTKLVPVTGLVLETLKYIFERVAKTPERERSRGSFRF